MCESRKNEKKMLVVSSEVFAEIIELKERLESIIETVEIMNDPELIKELKSLLKMLKKDACMNLRI